MATHRSIPGANLPQSGPASGRTGDLGSEVGRDRGTGLGNSLPGTSASSGGASVNASTSSESSAQREFPRVAGMMDRVKHQASTRVNEQKERAADGLGSVAAAIRQASEHLRQENQTLAVYADKAVDQIQHFADRMRDKDPAEMMRNLEQFARRNPTAFVGGAFLLGIGMARFLKSSEQAGNGGYDARHQTGDFESRSLAGGTGFTGTAPYGAGGASRTDDPSRSPGLVTDPAPGITS